MYFQSFFEQFSFLRSVKVFFAVVCLLLVLFCSRDSHARPADYLISLIRHGDRSPRDVQGIHQYWPMGPGQLTREGWEQLYQLGQQIRRYYFQETLPTAWSPQLSEHVAKGVDRTIQSAYALLQGMYSSPGGMPVQIPPVFATPLTGNELFSALHLCPGFLDRSSRLEKSADFLQKKRQYSARLQKWFLLSGADNTGELRALIPLMDQVAIHRLHHLPMPKGIAEDEARELDELLNWIISRTMSDEEIAQLIGTPLMNAIINDLERARQCFANEQGQASCQRWRLYSGSDNNLLAIMAMLGAPSETIAEYGTHLGIQFNWNDGNPKITLTLNHQPWSIPGCPGHCSFEQLLALLKRSLPTEWERLCVPPHKKTNFSKPWVPAGSVASR